MKSRRRSIYYPPTSSIDLDRPPGAVTEIEIEFPAVECDAQVDGSFLAVEQCFCLEQLQRSADGLRARAVAGLAVIGPQLGASFLDLARLQRRHRVWRFDSSVWPPLLTGTM